MNTQTKKRGRPVGARSFTAMTLEQLNGLFKQDTVIPVGRVWLEKQSTATQTVVAVDPAVNAGPEDKVEMSLSE